MKVEAIHTIHPLKRSLPLVMADMFTGDVGHSQNCRQFMNSHQRRLLEGSNQ